MEYAQTIDKSSQIDITTACNIMCIKSFKNESKLQKHQYTDFFNNTYFKELPLINYYLSMNTKFCIPYLNIHLNIPLKTTNSPFFIIIYNYILLEYCFYFIHYYLSKTSYKTDFK